MNLQHGLFTNFNGKHLVGGVGHSNNKGDKFFHWKKCVLKALFEKKNFLRFNELVN